MKSDLSIFILKFNPKDVLDTCLSSILKTSKNLTLEIIVVDNNSSDGSFEMVKTKYPEVQLIQNNRNLGFSAGNNAGIKKARGKYILFLNSDTEVIGNSLLTMVKLLDNKPNIGILGPKLVYPDKTIQKSVGNFYSLPEVIFDQLGGGKLGLVRSSPVGFKIVDWVSGACFLVRREVFDRIGLWDENLFMYMEEVEFCYRAKQNGILTAFLPEAEVIHKERGSSTSGREAAILNIYKGLIYFYQKHRSAREQKILKLILWFKAYLLNFFGFKIYGKALELF